ncbi:hypothetical protein CN169_28025 [Sinorhizobium meliloti]|nr:hypothetical protein CN169_28025 [Sinorhizobium meliloti]
MKFSDLLIREREDVVRLTPVQRQDIDIGEDEPYASLNNGLWLIKIVDDKPAAIMLSKFLTRSGPKIQVEICHMLMSWVMPSPSTFCAQLRRRARAPDIFATRLYLSSPAKSLRGREKQCGCTSFLL